MYITHSSESPPALSERRPVARVEGKVRGSEDPKIGLSLDAPVPVRALAGFRRISLKPGEHQVVGFTLAPRALSIVDPNGQRIIEPGTLDIAVGGKQPGFKGVADASTTQARTTRARMTGARVVVK